MVSGKSPPTHCFYLIADKNGVVDRADLAFLRTKYLNEQSCSRANTDTEKGRA